MLIKYSHKSINYTSTCYSLYIENKYLAAQVHAYTKFEYYLHNAYYLFENIGCINTYKTHPKLCKG